MIRTILILSVVGILVVGGTFGYQAYQASREVATPEGIQAPVEPIVTVETPPILEATLAPEPTATPMTVAKWQPVIDTSQAMSIVASMPDSIGLPVHSDSPPNNLCAYWLPPEAAVADDVGPNSGGRYMAENTYEWTAKQIRALASDTIVPSGEGTTLVLEAVFARVRFADGTVREFRPSVEKDGVFVVIQTERVESFQITSGAWFAVRSEQDVAPFVEVRIAHLRCRTVDNEVIDLR